MHDNDAQLVWSPRSNVALYGETAPVTVFDNMGVTVALGTDWTLSGSANILRELACADYLDENHYDDHFTDRDLWLMATRNAAIALGAKGTLGRLREGLVADIAIFDQEMGEDHSAVIGAHAGNVELVLRGGHPLTGDATVMEGLLSSGDWATCEDLEDCVSDHVVCMLDDTGKSLAEVLGDVAGSYDYTICDVPSDEPTCEPLRNDEDGDGLVFPDASIADADGDGEEDSADNCPNVFNPALPHMIFVQNDADGDGLGDACDPCPLSTGASCTWRDDDQDGITNLDDNCPGIANIDQDDGDGDLVGDACDACPAFYDADGACPVSVYDIKQETIDLGTPVVLEHMVVTATNDSGAYVQLDENDASWSGYDWSGTWLYMPDLDKPAIGDMITVRGTTKEYFDQIQLDSIVSWTVEQSGMPEPTPVIIDPSEIATGGGRAWELEGVVVQVEDVTVTSTNPRSAPATTTPTTSSR